MKPTLEQQQVIDHPTGKHGRVLSVAGSGKTTTMAYRIKHLTMDVGIAPQSIQVLMFNRNARTEFQERLETIELPKQFRPKVNTFHSYAYNLWMDDKRAASEYQTWTGENEEQHTINLRRAVDAITATLPEEEQDNIPELEECEQAIALYKSKLIKPANAGYRSHVHAKFILQVYQEYEKRRSQANAYTYDDFVPKAIEILKEKEPSNRPHLRHIIVDEYQDINYGQQYLLELLAENGADLMVVGDDDQTIYEWRGARPEFIIKEFQNIFTNKPHATYKLTHSFRFGYQIAQCADNIIAFNTNRTTKGVIAAEPTKPSEVDIIPTMPGNDDSNRQLANETIALVTRHDIEPAQIRVLGRTRAQMNSLSTEFILKQIPHQFEGAKPLFKTTEVQTLLDYVVAASELHKPINKTIEDRLLRIANRPNRVLSREAIKSQAAKVQRSSGSTLDMLTPPTADKDPQPGEKTISKQTGDAMLNLRKCLEVIFQAIATNPTAGAILEKTDDTAGLSQHYQDFYGKGQKANDRISNLSQAKRYAQETGMNLSEFMAHIPKIDPTLGLPPDELITFSTIHRVKGLEFDYVIIPECREGTMPILAYQEDPTYHKGHPTQNPSQSEWIESERRLFYVAITRAKKGIYIGTNALPPKLSQLLGFNTSRATESLRSSQFIEEIELDVVKAADSALQQAFSEQANCLSQFSKKYGGHHRIINLIKTAYAHHLPPAAKQEAAAMQIRKAERAFTYAQTYGSPDHKQHSLGTEPIQRTMWQHLRN